MSKSIGATKQDIVAIKQDLRHDLKQDLVEMEGRLVKTMHEMMQEMLGAIQHQFELRDEKVETATNRIDNIEATVIRVENKLDAINDKVDSHEFRIRTLERQAV